MVLPCTSCCKIRWVCAPWAPYPRGQHCPLPWQRAEAPCWQWRRGSCRSTLSCQTIRREYWKDFLLKLLAFSWCWTLSRSIPWIVWRRSRIPSAAAKPGWAGFAGSWSWSGCTARIYSRFTGTVGPGWRFAGCKLPSPLWGKLRTSSSWARDTRQACWEGRRSSSDSCSQLPGGSKKGGNFALAGLALACCWLVVKS